MADSLASIATRATLFVRISADDDVLYANAAFAEYLGLSKDVIKGTPVEVLESRLSGEVAECLRREQGALINRLVTDGSNRVFEVRSYTDGAVLDVVLHEVTNPAAIIDSFRGSVAGSGELLAQTLTEDETRTFWHPERRILSVTRTILCGLDELAATLAPVEVRLMVNSFVEEAAEAVAEAGGAVGDTGAGLVEGIFGAPRYYRDHPLRALRAAFTQLENAAVLRAGLCRQGKELPPLAVGIACGEVLLTSLPAGPGNRFAVSGPSSALAEQLSRLARPGEILISRNFLIELRNCLPAGWEFLEAESEAPPDLADMQWAGGELAPLPESLQRRVCLVGPDVSSRPELAEFYFEFLFTVRAGGLEGPVPILRVIRPDATGAAIELSEDNIVTTPVAQVLGKYKLLEVVGQGGMGKVWRGQDRFGNVVAIKVLSGAGSSSGETVKRFQREAEIMARLPHRNICRIFEINTFEGIPFIAMEFVEGITLADLLYEPAAANTGGARDLAGLIHAIRTGRPQDATAAERDARRRPRQSRVLPVEQTLNLVGKICDAIQFAHEHGVLHRDLKPGNVLLREDGEPLVADFGLAKAPATDGSDSLSVSGNMVGTIENMSPEQAESSKDVDERADVFSIGTILYQMVTGRRHFEATGNLVADAQSLKNHVPPRPRQLNPAIDPDLELICLKALRNVPGERYRSVAALRADLERFRRGEVISARPVTTLELARKLIQRNRAVAVVAGVSLLLFLVFAMVAFWQINDRRIEAEHAALRAEAERQKADAALEQAERHRLEAEERRRVAEATQRDLEDALAEAERARDAEKNAARQRRLAIRETEEERKARIEAEEARQKLEERAVSLEDKAGTLEQQLAALRESTEAAPRRADPVPTADILMRQMEEVEAAKDALRRARMIFAFELSSFELDRHARNHGEILRRVCEALGLAAQAVSVDPTHPPALILKGRLHLALLEFDAAVESFSRAMASPVSAVVAEEFWGGSDPEVLIGAARAGTRSPAAWKEDVVGPLLASGAQEDAATADLVHYFAQAPSATIARAGGSSGSIQRPTTPGEVLLALIERNPGKRPLIEIHAGTGRPALVEIRRAAALRDLSPLTWLPVSEVFLSGAEAVDWESLGRLNLRKLVIADSSTGAPPGPASTGFSGLVEAGFPNTDLPHIGFLRPALALERLDLSDTAVVDLAPLESRRLRYLDLSGTNPASLLPLSRMPLEHLVLDRAMTAETGKLHMLRWHRTLRFLRVPGDPENQTTEEFWRKRDRGDYAVRDPGADGAPGGTPPPSTEEQQGAEQNQNSVE